MGASQAAVTATSGRKALGAWYTPPALVDHLVERALTASVAGRAVRVLDPACGDGRLLAAAAARIRQLGGHPHLVGVDVDAEAVRASRGALVGEDATIIHDDALRRDWSCERFDVVVGNPPFLSQMATASTRGGSSRHGGGPYANTAVEFLALALTLTERGGQVAMVLPMSILASRDATPVREHALRTAAMRWAWWADTSVFDADVRTCALGFEVGAVAAGGDRVERSHGANFERLHAIPQPHASWSGLLAGQHCVAPLGPLRARGTLGDHAAFGANFRDEYYGMVGAVRDGADGPPLVTCGLIDPGWCAWGERPARFGKQQFDAPRIQLDALSPTVRAWAERHLRPKVLIANQTTIVEAVADEGGRWVPSVPVVNAVPRDADELWSLAAVLTSPVASAWVAEHAAGSGLSARSVRLSPTLLTALPWPAGEVQPAAEALRAGDLGACGSAVTSAYGLPADGELHRWWISLVERATPTRVRR